MPRYDVTIKRWADWTVEADTAEEAEEIAMGLAQSGGSPDSDYYLHECDDIKESE